MWENKLDDYVRPKIATDTDTCPVVYMDNRMQRAYSEGYMFAQKKNIEAQRKIDEENKSLSLKVKKLWDLLLSRLSDAEMKNVNVFFDNYEKK